MEIRISDCIRKKRREMDISQEALANEFGVSVQAVSKWETGASFPDITLLPKIAEFFEMTIDDLFYNKETSGKSVFYDEIPNDDKFRIVQLKGNTVLTSDIYDPNIRIMLEMPDTIKNDKHLGYSFEIWGSADIRGSISGNVNAGDGINCGSIGGNVNAGDGINCGNIGGNVNAGDGICCGNISGDAVAGDGICCGDIGNNAKSEGDIHCRKIKGNATCGGNIIYE